MTYKAVKTGTRRALEGRWYSIKGVVKGQAIDFYVFSDSFYSVVVWVVNNYF